VGILTNSDVKLQRKVRVTQIAGRAFRRVQMLQCWVARFQLWWLIAGPRSDPRCDSAAEILERCALKIVRMGSRSARLLLGPSSWRVPAEPLSNRACNVDIDTVDSLCWWQQRMLTVQVYVCRIGRCYSQLDWP
jgi:hypothetical protein